MYLPVRADSWDPLLLFSHSVMSDSFETPRTVAYQASPFMGLPRQKCWSGLLFSPPGDLPDPRIKPVSPALVGELFTTESPGGSSEVPYCYCLVAKWCLTRSNPMDCNPSGSSVHGISPARILEWVAISFSRGSSWSRDRTLLSCTGRQIVYCWATREALPRRPETLPWEPCYSDACLSTSLDALGRKFYAWLRRRPEGPVDGNCPHRVVGSLWIWLGKPLSQSVKSWHPFPMFIHQLACLSNDIKLVCVWGSFLHLTIQTCDCHSFGTCRDDRLV